MKMQPVLYIVVPCYNEQEVLPETSGMFLEEISELIGRGKISDQSRILFVNDGSKDKTWSVISSLAREDEHFAGISLSRNRGHQNAVLAGLMEAKQYCDITISIDADGQDDIHVMEEMVDRYAEGCEVVYGVRSKRTTDTFLKRFTAETFYRLLSIMGCEIVFNHADYRLMSARVLDEFENYHEVNIFLRGMVPLVGFKSTSVYYERKERLAGKSHYSIARMLALAIDGITSLSIRPIRIITLLGFLISFLSFIGLLWAIATKLLGRAVDGWSSMVSILCFFSGIQLLCLGVIGEYVGKTYLEAKARPRFIISRRTYDEVEKRRTGEKDWQVRKEPFVGDNATSAKAVDQGNRGRWTLKNDCRESEKRNCQDNQSKSKCQENNA